VKVSLFYLPSIGHRREIERGCAGLRGDLYGRMLDELAEQAVDDGERGVHVLLVHHERRRQPQRVLIARALYLVEPLRSIDAGVRLDGAIDALHDERRVHGESHRSEGQRAALALRCA